MQIVIPMSGTGERFQKAGYKVPKPLIEIEGKPIIAHVIDLFPGETDFTFICNREHLANADWRMEAILKKYAPTARIISIEPHKLGPVHAVQQAIDQLDPLQPVIVNYCDFACIWDYEDFKQFVGQKECDGAIAVYRGFHPHMLGSTSYAYVQEKNGWVSAIQEKKPFTTAPMNEFASSGAYYFRTAALLKEYADVCLEQKLHVNGEHYVSLVYAPMLDAGYKVAVYEIDHFMQWGTPEDFAEYKNWSDAFRALATPAPPAAAHAGAAIIPMAGAGKRFADEGYTLPKPLLPVSGKPMVLQAMHDLPRAPRMIFVVRKDLPNLDSIRTTIRQQTPEAEFVNLAALTEGQAITALKGLDLATPKIPDDAPITIGACDNGMLYVSAEFQHLMNDPKVDIIVWGMRGHAAATRKPPMFGWIDADEHGKIRRVSVKTPLADPLHDPIITGCFTFKRAGDFRRAVAHMTARNARINDEFYIDTSINDAIELGLHAALFTVDHYFGWGTPNELKTFNYWQACFDQWHAHPYSLEKDTHAFPAAE